MQDNYKKLGKNIFSLTLGSFGSKLLTFLFVPFYTAVLSTEEYGTADLITVTVSLLFPFFSLIICEAMLRFAQEKEIDLRQIFSIGLYIWLIGLIILLMLSPLLNFIPSLRSYSTLILIYYCIYSLNMNIGYYVRGIGEVTVYSISGIITTICTIIFNLIFLLLFKMGVVGYIASIIISSSLSTLYMILATQIYKNRIPIKSIDKNILKKMLSFSIPLIPNSASWWISNSSDKYILTFFEGASANGIYSVAYKIPTIIMIVTNIFTTAWRLSAVYKFGTDASKRFYSNVFDMYITLTVGMASCLMLLNKPLSYVLYLKEFYEAWKFVPVLILASVILSYSDFLGTIYTSAYKTTILFYSTLLGAISNLILNFWLIPRCGAIGAAVATLLSYVVTFVIRMINSREILKIQYKIKEDILCILIITVQLIVSSSNLKSEYLVSFACLVLLIVIKKENILELMRKIIQSISNRISRKEL